MLSLLGYIDASSGMFVMQFIAAAVISAGVIFRDTMTAPFRWSWRLIRGRRETRDDGQS